MSQRSYFVQRLRAYLKVLNTPASAHPRIAKAADDVGKTVVVMTGVIWASLLGAYMAATDDAVRNGFAVTMVPSLWLFVYASIVQIFQATYSPKALNFAIYWFCYVAIGGISLSLLTFSGGFIWGVQDYRNSSDHAALMKINECFARHTSKFDGLNRRYWQAETELSDCVNIAESDALRLHIALAENRISKEQWRFLLSSTLNRCKLDSMKNYLEQMKSIERENCDPTRMLKKYPRPTP